MKRILLALALLLPTSAFAQCNGTFPNNTVCGNVTGSTNLPRATSPSAFLGAAGGTNGQQQYNSGGALAGFTQSGDVTVNTSTGASTISPNAVTNSKIASGAANTMKGSLNGSATSDISLTACTLTYQITKWVAGTGWQCGFDAVLPARAIAATIDLSAFTAVRTLGYVTAGDGGGATFKKVAVPFRDSFVTGLTITTNGTSGCTNGTVRNKFPTGGTGNNLILNLTVAGNVVTAVQIMETGGNAYTVGDVLTVPSVPGCAGAVTVTVSAVSTPSGSFTDSAANKWQIIRDENNFNNTRQFGAKADWAGNDATATNDYTSIQNAIGFCADPRSPTIDAGGTAGCRLILPNATSMICGGVPLNVSQGVTIEGHGMWTSAIEVCATWGATANFLNICDPNTQASCFAALLRNFTLRAPFNLAGNAGVSAIYSNNVQQVDVIDRVAVYAGRRRCLTLETGYGGAALLGIQNFECTPGDTSTTNTGIHINYGTTLVTMRNVHVETSGPNTMIGIAILGGFVELTGFHTEGISTGIQSNISGSSTNGIVRLFNLSGGASCTDLVLRAGIANVTVVGNAVPNGCTNTVNNSGAPTTTPVVANTTY